MSVLLTVTGTTAVAQPSNVVTSGKVEHSGDSAFVILMLDPDEMSVDDKQVMSIRPRLTGMDGHDVSLPAIHVMGRHPYYRHLRGQRLPSTDPARDIFLWEKRCYDDEWRRYVRGLPFRSWMDSCQLVVTIEVGDECAVQQTHTATVMQTAQKKQRIRLSEPKLITLTDGGTANVQFLNNDTHLLPDMWQNKNELGKITESINKVLADTTATLLKLHLHGYASPDGPLWNNKRLAHERVDSVRRYIIDNTALDPDQIETEATPEDWIGLLRYVEQRSDEELPHRREIISVINGNMNPDQKEHRLRTLYPEDFAFLLEEGLPGLRRTDYQIDYTRKQLTRQDPIIDSIWHMPDASSHPALQPGRMNTYIPIIAVKTNLLWWAVAAPNIELELPFGKKRQWSAMAEFWCPWYVWHHNSRAYEVMVIGAELRRWYGACRDKNRAPLTGLFLGLYAAGGKYDIEWNSVGDQGEFFSGGVTVGYAWPVHRRLNLELSGSVGAFGGPRRHYHGEFDDTHLIWKYNSSTFYAGPTKLKLSLVWLLGSKGQSITRRGMEKERQRNRREARRLNEMFEKVYNK